MLGLRALLVCSRETSTYILQEGEDGDAVG